MRASISYLDIPARDAVRAAAFFRSVFGWVPRRREWSEGMYFALDGATTDVRCGLVEAGVARIDAPLPVVHVEIGDLEACLARVEAAGGKIIEAPRRIDTAGVFARFEDSEGNVWGVWAPGPTESCRLE